MCPKKLKIQFLVNPKWPPVPIYCIWKIVLKLMLKSPFPSTHTTSRIFWMRWKLMPFQKSISIIHVDIAPAARGGQFGKKYLNENYAHSLKIISAQNSITFCLSLVWIVYANMWKFRCLYQETIFIIYFMKLDKSKKLDII